MTNLFKLISSAPVLNPRVWLGQFWGAGGLPRLTSLPRRNETCVVRNTSKILIFWHNSTLAHGKAPAAAWGWDGEGTAPAPCTLPLLPLLFGIPSPRHEAILHLTTCLQLRGKVSHRLVPTGMGLPR